MKKIKVSEGPMKEYGKYYFKQLLAQAPTNLNWGDKLTFRIQYLGPDGKVHSQVTTEINKSEL